MSILSGSIHQFHQFKNAIHVAKTPSEAIQNFKLQFSPQKSMKKDNETRSQISLFGASPLSKHFKDIDLTSNKSKSSLEGFGITVDDYGHLLIAQWRNNQIQGKYFLFQPNLVQQGDKNNIYSAICQYGQMKGGNLQGQSYIYNITGTLAKAHFENSKIMGKCYIIHNNKLFVANEAQHLERVQCEIINNQSKKQENKKDNQNPNILKIPKITGISQSKLSRGNSQMNKFPSNFQQIQANTFVKPNIFLEQLVRSYQKKGEKNNNESLVYTRINERQFFLGFIQSDKKLIRQSSSHSMTVDHSSKINGFGVILKNQWPTSYGTYKQGKLQGLGRVYETQMNLLDGYFTKGELMQGFIIDYFANTTSFGHQSSIDPQYNSQPHDQNCFIITNTFETLSSEYILEYKKNFHLKSLNFNNSYFNSPKLIHRSPWPYNIINKLTKRSQMQTIIKSFRPTLRDMEISQIEKVGHSSENRVEKMLIQEIRQSNNPLVRDEGEVVEKQEMLKQKSIFIKNEIQKNLKEKEQVKEEKTKQKEIAKYINEYKRLERRKTQIIQQKQAKTNAKKASSNQSITQPFQPASHPPVPIVTISPLTITPSKSTSAKKLALTPVKLKDSQISVPKEEDLTQLVQQYEQCETERKNSISGGGNTTRRTNTDRRPTPRELSSKRKLIQQDHQYFMGQQKRNTPSKSYKPRRKVDLDLIYRQYLQK